MTDRRENGTFKQGVSGNPGGRSRQAAEIRELARARTECALNTLTAIMENQKAPAAARVSAANAILDRGWGRPLQSNRLEFEAENPWQEIMSIVKNASTEDLERSLEEMDREIAVGEAQRNPETADA